MIMTVEGEAEWNSTCRSMCGRGSRNSIYNLIGVQQVCALLRDHQCSAFGIESYLAHTGSRSGATIAEVLRRASNRGQGTGPTNGKATDVAAFACVQHVKPIL